MKRIRDLVNAGATVIGAKPQSSLSLADAAAEFRSVADSLWGTDANSTARDVGKGRVINGTALDQLLPALGIQPDFVYHKPSAESQILFVHRGLDDGELYFVDNREAQSRRIEASFRVRGRVPELWHADSGRIEPVSYRIEGVRTVVPLELASAESVFVVFRKPAMQSQVRLSPARRTALTSLTGPWAVHFAPGQDASERASVAELTSWSVNENPDIKYYSGTARYQRSFNVPPRWLTQDQRIELDLGSVKDLAEVVVNGKPAGIVWKTPFRLDVTDVLKAGENKLEVRVTNTWVNRLIGDKQPGAKQRAFATYDPYKANSPLLESGLLGPVQLFAVTAGPAQSESH